MTSPHPNGRSDPDDGAECLSAGWDELVAGHPVEIDDEGLVTLAQRLHATTTTTRERPGFRNQLRETVMHAATAPIAHPGPSPATPAGATHRLPAALPTLGDLRRVGGRWLSLAATVVLLFATAAGGYLAGVGLPGNDGRAPSMAGFQGATPETGDAPMAFGCGPDGAYDLYLPCGGQRPNIVSSGYLQAGLVDAPNFPSEDFDVSQVQMQRWQIEHLQSLTFTAPVTPLTGIGMDVVINGAYTATFSGPVTVMDDQSGIRGLPQYFPANTVVELVSGDSVAYELGTKLEIRNPLASSLLQFKTILFHDGDPSPANLGAAGDVRMMIDGDGVLPKLLSAYSPSGAGVVLTYSQILEGHPFPPESKTYALVLGPVDPVNGPAGTEGFILWVYQGLA